MTDDGHDPDSKEGEAFNAREDALEAAMPVLAEFFHIVRCPNHSKEDRTAAYEAACEVWDTLEEAYVHEVSLSERLNKLGGMTDGDRNPGRGNHGEYGGEGRIGTKPDGEHAITHPGSRAIN